MPWRMTSRFMSKWIEIFLPSFKNLYLVGDFSHPSVALGLEMLAYGFLIMFISHYICRNLQCSCECLVEQNTLRSRVPCVSRWQLVRTHRNEVGGYTLPWKPHRGHQELQSLLREPELTAMLSSVWASWSRSLGDNMAMLLSVPQVPHVKGLIAPFGTARK